MNSDLPKVLQPLAGQPLLQHVIRTAERSSRAKICVVYGHGGAAGAGGAAARAGRLGAAGRAAGYRPRRHAGHGHHSRRAHRAGAVRRRAPDRRRLARKTARAGARGALALLSVELDEAAGYGRIVRDDGGRSRRHRRAQGRERRAAADPRGELPDSWRRRPSGCANWLLGVGNDNAQREYYLTDVVAVAVLAGLRVEAVLAEAAEEVMGVNDRMQLAEPRPRCAGGAPRN